MTTLAATEHFAGAPHWTWYILFYFFLAGLAGGSYFLATLLRHWGAPTDEPVARVGFYVAFVATLICPILLTLDLTHPLRFWHMVVNTTPGNTGLNFRSETPMSVGVWALLVASVFSLVSFVDTLARDGRLRHPLARRLAGALDGGAGKVWNVAGSVVYLFVAAYTGVLLAVSNQPVWSDSWALGGLFLASGLSGSAALMLLLTRYRRGAEASRGFLEIGGRLFTVLELALLVVFALTLIDDGALDTAFGFPWILLWLVALAGMLPGLVSLAVGGLRVDGTAERVATWAVVAPALVLVGVLALRAAVIFSAQA
ncbi:MAG TPA: NrfD/PsrC family molybdoenzyme membrane anchor subunit [Solirubrobacteraceae bacterium]